MGAGSDSFSMVSYIRYPPKKFFCTEENKKKLGYD